MLLGAPPFLWATLVQLHIPSVALRVSCADQSEAASAGMSPLRFAQLAWPSPPQDGPGAPETRRGGVV